MILAQSRWKSGQSVVGRFRQLHRNLGPRIGRAPMASEHANEPQARVSRGNDYLLHAGCLPIGIRRIRRDIDTYDYSPNAGNGPRLSGDRPD